MSVLDKLTEGIVNRDLAKEGAALLDKWEKTGLLEGLGDGNTKNGMALLLENQAKELLREASTLSAGDVEGFAAVAFPIVRRVFGNLIANELVSVQPMSLPSGLIFFLDFQANSARLGYEANDSLYGGGVVGQQITGGVDLTGENAEDGPYNLNSGYASPTGSFKLCATLHAGIDVLASGTFGGAANGDKPAWGNAQATTAMTAHSAVEQSFFDKACRFDPDFTSGSTDVLILKVPTSASVGGTTLSALLNGDNLAGVCVGSTTPGTDGTLEMTSVSGSLTQVRRLTQYSGSAKDHILVFFAGDDTGAQGNKMGGPKDITLHMSFPLADEFTNVGTRALGGVVADSSGDPTGLDLEDEAGIPEIDIKVDSVSVTARTKKLKAKWTPELGQDLNAYHNLDAEVELTGILSEQIALEIDREILEDLIKGAKAETYYWSRRPGRFLDRNTGLPISTLSNESLLGADFTGNVSEWYETLVETINDVSAQIHRKTLRGGANFIVCSPEVANILEFTAGFRANVTHDDDKGTVGAVNVGSLSKKWDVYVDPYFPRNVVLVGRNGNSFLESGYVYAPYVPLQVTPTIFGIDDFTPRKGVMTRYAKKMVRPDMYGLVIVADLLG